VVRTAASTIQVVLADDHPLVRLGIRSLLGTIPGVHVIAEVGDGMELMELLDSILPDVVITDISMPGMDGLEALRCIHSRHPEVKVIVLSMHDSPEIVKRAVAGGASAYLRKDASDFELASAIHGVMTTGSYMSAAVARSLMEPTEPAAQEVLTQRQIAVLKLLAEGRTSKEVGFVLGLSSKTIDVHRIRIMERLGKRDLPGLVVYALRHGII
jgi:DNA-binding NarL/FixJ family response regulator